MTDKEKHEAETNDVSRSHSLADLAQILQEELDYIRTIRINEIPTPEEQETRNKKFQEIFETKELSGFDQQWKEADPKKLKTLNRKNLLSDNEKLLLRIDDLLRAIKHNLRQLKIKITLRKALKKLVPFNPKSPGNK
jgi:hypothetical protein